MAPVFNKLQEILLKVVQLKSAQAAENDERPLYRNRRGRKKKKKNVTVTYYVRNSVRVYSFYF